MKKLPLVSVITVNYNGKKFLKGCFGSLYKLNYPKNRLEIIMVDNGSSDGSVEFAKRNFPKVKVISNDVNNYCRANNLAILQARGKYVAILNNDTKVDKNWLIELVKVIESDKSIGAVGSKILLMNGKIESVWHQELPDFYWMDKGFGEKDRRQYDKLQEVNSLCGCAILYRKRSLKNTGDFDEDFNIYMEDIDISMRLRKAGWKLVYAPKSLVRHIHHGTAQENLSLFYTERNRLLLVAKYYPKKLSSALLGRGYFTAKTSVEQQAGLYKILSDLISKLIKHHKTQIIKDVLTELSEELKKISNFENNVLADKIKDLLKSIELHQEAIKEKDLYIDNLNLEIGQREEAIKEKDLYIDNLNLEIKKRLEAIKEKDVYIDSLNNAVSAKDNHIDSLNQTVSAKDNHIDSLNQTVSAKDSHINNLEKEFKNKEKELKDLYESTAFRFLVKPLWTSLWKIKQTIKNINVFSHLSKETTRLRDKSDVVSYGREINVANIGICTIISKNYLAYARVLTESYLKYNQGQVFVLLTDQANGYFDPAKEKFVLIEVNTIKDKIKDFEKFCFQYNATEFNTAVKPFFLEFLFEKYNLRKLVFFDPDILITNNLSRLFELLDKSSIILIPHITRPYSDNSKPTEINILKSGIYNLGFIALSYTKNTEILIKWWKERLERYCKSDVENSLFVDQRWIDLIPGFFDDVFILKDETYNVAYWNLHYRKVYKDGSKILVNSKPAHFLHFSGFNPNNLNSVSKHQDRYALKDLEHMRPIFELYKDSLLANGYDESKDWPCVFNYFDNGVKVPDIARQIYWKMAEKAISEFRNPFKANSRESYFNWLNENIDIKKPNITNLKN